MSEPTDRKKSNAAERLLKALQDANGEAISGLDLRDKYGGGHNYTGRIGQLREKGWIIDEIPTPESEFSNYRLVGLGDPAMTTNVNVKMTYLLLDRIFRLKDKNVMAELKQALWDGYLRSKKKKKEAEEYQAKLQGQVVDVWEFLSSGSSGDNDNDNEDE